MSRESGPDIHRVALSPMQHATGDYLCQMLFICFFLNVMLNGTVSTHFFLRFDNDLTIFSLAIL